MKYIPALFCLAILFACGKEFEKKPAGKVFPQKYFPVYPGSWWIYSNPSVVQTKDSVENDWQYHYLQRPDGRPVSDPKWVPKMNGKYYYGYYHTVYDPVYPGIQYQLIHYMNETDGLLWHESNYHYQVGFFTYEKATVFHSDDTISINAGVFSNLIMVEIEERHFPSPTGQYRWERHYYAENVGLIYLESSSDHINWNMRKQLDAYFIND